MTPQLASGTKGYCALVGCLILFLILVLPLPGLGAEAHLIKFATVAPEGSTWMKHMRRLDQRIRRLSNGRVGFKIYPGGVAGDELDVIKKIRIGQIQGAALSGTGFGRILQSVRILDLPLLFREAQDLARVRKALTPYFREAFQKRGFVLLSWVVVGDVHVFAPRPLSGVKDFAGLRVWTWSGDPIAKETFLALGVNPIPLPVTEVHTALSTGMVNTVYGPVLGALALQWYRYTPFMMRPPLARSTGAILLSRSFAKSLPEDLCSLLLEEVPVAMEELADALAHQRVEALEVMKKGGLTLSPPPSQSQRQALHRIGEKVADRMAGELYPESLLERVRALLKP